MVLGVQISARRQSKCVELCRGGYIIQHLPQGKSINK